jgi:hypothetical protein
MELSSWKNRDPITATGTTYSRPTSRHTLLSNSSSFSSLRTSSSCDSLVSYFGGATASDTTISDTDAKPIASVTNKLIRPTPPRRQRQRQQRRKRRRRLNEGSWDAPTTSSHFTCTCHIISTPRLIQWVLVASSCFVVLEHLAFVVIGLHPYSISLWWQTTPTPTTMMMTELLTLPEKINGSTFNYASPLPLSQQDQQQLPKEIPGFHIVVSHCDKSLDWLWQHIEKTKQQLSSSSLSLFLLLQNVKSVTIFSKCGQEGTILQQQQQEKTTITNTMAKVIVLPNVGRCDHSYAYIGLLMLGNI